MSREADREPGQAHRPGSGPRDLPSGHEGGHRPITIPIQTVKQAEFVARLRALTNDLTMRPAIPPQVIELE